MRIKNASTSVSAEKSLMKIEEILKSFGANTILKENLSDGRVTCICFKLEGKGYKIPANFSGVHNVLFKNKTPNSEAQAYRVVWRIIKDWIYTQLSLVASGQAQPDELLLPYMYNGKTTLYQMYKEGTLQIENQGGQK